MSILLKNIVYKCKNSLVLRKYEIQICYIASRNLSVVPSLYDGENDPAPKFFSPNVQTILKRLTRPDYAKVFRKRTNSGLTVLKTPKYKFLTTEELEEEIAKANAKAKRLLQMPPIVKTHKPIDVVISKDPAVIGYSKATHLFTDISFGVANAHRLIWQRDPDGTLRFCDHAIRKRLNQTYFPNKARKIKDPIMFTDEEKLENLLNREEYLFILDRACVQYEPDEPMYQKITSITYQYIDMNKHFDSLRSTRHFGCLVFYLTWHQSIENLMLELIQTGAVREAILLLAAKQAIHSDIPNHEEIQALTEQILQTPIQLTKPDHLTEEDIQLDTKCVECVEKHVKTSAMRGQQELALQGFREEYQQLVELSRGLQKAHGKA